MFHYLQEIFTQHFGLLSPGRGGRTKAVRLDGESIKIQSWGEVLARTAVPRRARLLC